MALRGRRRRLAAAEVSPLVETKLAVVREDSSFVADDGSTIHSLGYMLLDPVGEFTGIDDDDWLRVHGCRLSKVAGLTHHPEAAQDDGLRPGTVVVLAPDPENPVDPHAVGVWERSGERRIGFVPAERSQEIAERIAAGEMLGAAVLREYRTKPTGGRRLGLLILIAPVGTVTLQMQARPPAPSGGGDA